jgi:hypothetical protein
VEEVFRDRLRGVALECTRCHFVGSDDRQDLDRQMYTTISEGEGVNMYLSFQFPTWRTARTAAFAVPIADRFPAFSLDHSLRSYFNGGGLGPENARAISTPSMSARLEFLLVGLLVADEGEVVA